MGRPTHRGLAVAIILLVAFVHCGCSPKSPPPNNATSPSTASNNNAPPTTRMASPAVAVGEDLARLCQLTFGSDVVSAEKAPKFDFDKSELSAADRDVLTQIARCLTSGAMRGRAIKLVGRADSRGEAEYNMGLGGHRAGSVKSYLTQLGVESTKIAETSRGELDATGRDETGWRNDRRVDVVLQR